MVQNTPTTFESEGDRLDAIRRLIVTVQEQASPTDMVAQARIRKYRRWLHEMEEELGLDGYC